MSKAQNDRYVHVKFGSMVFHLLHFRLEKYKEARMDQMFPDEIDTPADTPARVRFQK